MQAYFEVLYMLNLCIKFKEDRLKHSPKDLFKLQQTDPKNSVLYEIDNLKADIQYATQKIELNRARAEMLAKQFELNKVLNTGDDSVMYDTQESTLFESWAF